MSFFDQRDFEIRCEWGSHGLRELAAVSDVAIVDVVIVVDVLSFSTAVDIATDRGAAVFPYPFKDHSATAYAETVDATLGSSRGDSGFSLSPNSLLSVPHGCRLVLPSPNGSALCFEAMSFGADLKLMTACLRNASAVAKSAARLGSTFAVIPAGELWEDGTIRPSIEDLIGAGSVIARLPGRRSAEAELAVAAFEHFKTNLSTTLRECGSGRELIGRGFAADVDLAAQYDTSVNVPRLVDGAFRGLA